MRTDRVAWLVFGALGLIMLLLIIFNWPSFDARFHSAETIKEFTDALGDVGRSLGRIRDAIGSIIEVLFPS